MKPRSTWSLENLQRIWKIGQSAPKESAKHSKEDGQPVPIRLQKTDHLCRLKKIRSSLQDEENKTVQGA